ncbi:glycine betaine/proline transport system substrate-binding protein [Desulfitobacterium sp. LBE]|uniref:glycine betaine ABC transporter substrate-binding protein n=1 Tax=Desulfitobacterium sp. LBE TaxID=884086 RepID=UPI00119962E8|nr:glycine betaine ABC transporter substrate-binding protein [Desulfitobacterium sp. LBE]TWH56805.1 glycine betaine/proline transport system substrate-binding protein [Desulfitobacterium sp. LBE]
MKIQKSWPKALLWALTALLAIGLTGCGATSGSPSGNKKTNGSDKTVNIGYVNWAEAVAVSNLWKVILEEQGYNVKMTSLDAAPLFVGLSAGNLDIFMDSWLPTTHQIFWDKYKNKLDDYGVWYTDEAKIGLVVPEYVEISSIEELNAYKDRFSGRITGIDPGAGIMKATETAIDSYNLEFNLIQSSEAAMLAALDKAYRNQEWIAVTGWSPHWKFAKYDLKYLEDPKGSYGQSEQIHTLANKEFTQAHPEVAAMLKKFELNDQQLGTLEGYINEGMKPEEAAQKWMAENRDLVDSWLK